MVFKNLCVYVLWIGGGNGFFRRFLGDPVGQQFKIMPLALCSWAALFVGLRVYDYKISFFADITEPQYCQDTFFNQ